MSVEDQLFLLDSAHYVDISVGYYDCFWVVRKIVQIVELLNLV